MARDKKDRHPVGYFHKCSLCGMAVRTKIPKGCDESLLVPWKHRDFDGNPCDGHHYEAEEM